MEIDDLDRWKRDESFFGDKSRSLGMTVLRAVADGDQDRQNKQEEMPPGFPSEEHRAGMK